VESREARDTCSALASRKRKEEEKIYLPARQKEGRVLYSTRRAEGPISELSMEITKGDRLFFEPRRNGVVFFMAGKN